MNWILDIALYLLIWWIALFAVLPWGIKPAREAEQGHDAGAPAQPRLLVKAAVTTVVAALLWYVIHGALLWELARLRNQ